MYSCFGGCFLMDKSGKALLAWEYHTWTLVLFHHFVTCSKFFLLTFKTIYNFISSVCDYLEFYPNPSVPLSNLNHHRVVLSIISPSTECCSRPFLFPFPSVRFAGSNVLSPCLTNIRSPFQENCQIIQIGINRYGLSHSHRSPSCYCQSICVVLKQT